MVCVYVKCALYMYTYLIYFIFIYAAVVVVVAFSFTLSQSLALPFHSPLLIMLIIYAILIVARSWSRVLYECDVCRCPLHQIRISN